MGGYGVPVEEKWENLQGTQVAVYLKMVDRLVRLYLENVHAVFTVVPKVVVNTLSNM